MLRALPWLLFALLACEDANSNSNTRPRTGAEDPGRVKRPDASTLDATGGPGGADATQPEDAAITDLGALDSAVEADRAAVDAAVPDPDVAVPDPDAAVPDPDVAVPDPDVAVPDPDVAVPDPDVAVPDPDMALPDPDMALPDPDMALPDPDMAVDPGVPPGRRACSGGPGWTLFEVHWGNGGSSARVDHWDAPCDYSIRINDACGAFDRCGPADGIAGCDVAVVDQGQGLLLDGNDDLLFRFSVDGLQFSGVTLYFEARATRGAAEVEVISQLHGGLVGPINNNNYEVFETDWSENLRPGDRQGLTAIGFDATRGRVAIHAVEVCLIP